MRLSLRWTLDLPGVSVPETVFTSATHHLHPPPPQHDFNPLLQVRVLAGDVDSFQTASTPSTFPGPMSTYGPRSECLTFADDVYGWGASMFALFVGCPDVALLKLVQQMAPTGPTVQQMQQLAEELTGGALPDILVATICACLKPSAEARPSVAGLLASQVALLGGREKDGGGNSSGAGSSSGTNSDGGSLGSIAPAAEVLEQRSLAQAVDCVERLYALCQTGAGMQEHHESAQCTHALLALNNLLGDLQGLADAAQVDVQMWRLHEAEGMQREVTKVWKRAQRMGLV
mgnify:CR=1 FL=1